MNTNPGKSRPGSRRSATVKLLLCDDQRLIRACVREVLKHADSLEVVGEAENGKSAVAMALKLKPDIVLMDVSMPEMDGIEATRRILAKSPGIRILAFSCDSNPETVEKMFAAGAHGYALKNGHPLNLIEALQKVLAGQCFVSTRPTTPAVWSRPD
jgi:DNA-binding NarL/FixJ family response regulator